MSSLSKQNIISAILAIVGAISLSLSMFVAKQLHPNIPTILVVFIRSCFGLFFFIPILIANRKAIVRTKKLHLHVLRVVLTVGAMLTTYYAYRNLPLAFATSIGMSCPLFTTLLSVAILKEQISRIKWLIILVGYLGVIVVVRPTSLFLDLGTASSLLANLLAASVLITVKILSRYDSVTMIMLCSNIGITVISCLFNINAWQVISTHDLGLISIMGALGLITQICSVNSLKYSSPSFVAPFEYTRIFFAIILGITFLGEIPDLYTIVGSTIIILSAYALIYTNSKN